MASLPDDMYKPRTQGRGIPAVLIMTAHNVEDLELFYPYYRFIEAGMEVDICTPKGEAFQAKHGLGLKDSKKIADISTSLYQLLYIPGGQAPLELVKDKDAVRLTKEFFENGCPIAAFCHGPQVLAAAGIITGRRITAWPEIESEVEAAGATYVNQETVVDGQFITGRWPADLPAYVAHVLENIYSAKGKAGRAVA